MVPYNEAKRLITTVVLNMMLSYTLSDTRNESGYETCFRTMSENACVETLDAVYEDMESLINLNIANTMRCGQHVKNCALQNLLKIYNW